MYKYLTASISLIPLSYYTTSRTRDPGTRSPARVGWAWPGRRQRGGDDGDGLAA